MIIYGLISEYLNTFIETFPEIGLTYYTYDINQLYDFNINCHFVITNGKTVFDLAKISKFMKEHKVETFDSIEIIIEDHRIIFSFIQK